MSGLKIGQEITESELEKYKEGANEAKAYGLALRFLGVRMRSRRELQDYLARKNCSTEESEVALQRLEDLGLVDDYKFAAAWVADRQAVRPRSKMRLSQELAAKGVARDVVDGVLAELEPDDELQALKTLIERKRRLPAYQDTQKLTAYLQRQGYRWGLIKTALEQSEF